MKIQLTGDSLIARHEGLMEPMINYYLQKTDPGLGIYNSAFSGDNTFDILKRMDSEILSEKNCAKIFLLVGTNDLSRRKQVPLSYFRRNFITIIQKLQIQYKPQNVYIISPPAVDESKQQFRDNQLIVRYATIESELAKQFGCHYIDFYAAVLHNPDFPKMMQGQLDDGLHFGKAGYQLLAKLILNFI